VVFAFGRGIKTLPVRFTRVSSVVRVAYGRFSLRAGALCCILALAMAHSSSAQAPFVTAEGDLKTTAWWVVADFHPFTTEVRGIPANRIRKSWCKATEFRKDLIPKEWLVENGTDQMDASQLVFAVEGSFDGSATRQVALTGVYQECAGRKGSFILILDQPINPGKPRIRFLSTSETNHQFLALAKGKDNSIIAWSCMECDGRSILQWDRKKRKFGWLREPDDE